MNKEKYFEKHAILKTAEELEINFIPFAACLSCEVNRYFGELGFVFNALAEKRGLPNFVRNKEIKISQNIKEYARLLGVDRYLSDNDLKRLSDVSYEFRIPLRAVFYMWGYYRRDYYKLYEFRKLVGAIKYIQYVVNEKKSGSDVFSDMKEEEISEQAEEQEVK